ncbi:MAG: hypothetical protein M3Q33_04090 [Acidobacteriota bacterium]|nr:hypothetical protein [Acidobacteriota bacterium]
MIEQSEIELTKEDFIRSGWEDVISLANPQTCSFFSHSLSAKANDSAENSTKGIFVCSVLYVQCIPS